MASAITVALSTRDCSIGAHIYIAFRWNHSIGDGISL